MPRFSIARLAIIGFLCVIAVTPSLAEETDANPAPQTYEQKILADEPVGYWRFEAAEGDKILNRATSLAEPAALDGVVVGDVAIGEPGPRPGDYPLFDDQNRAAQFLARNSYLRIADPGEGSPLDFDNGDSITIEAWVNPQLNGRSDFHYIIGKGRMKQPGFVADNQNWALRLKSPSGQLSFLFRSAGEDAKWHRWTSNDGCGGGDGWHHVAVTYTFGESKSIAGYIDGKPVKGKWDYGGATDRAPVVDDDEVRIGSTYAGAAAFGGGLDELALYRRALTVEQISARYQYISPGPTPIVWERIPEGTWQVDIFEGLPDRKSWDFRPPKFEESYLTETLAFVDVPKKYNDRGLAVERSNPYLLRAAGTFEIPRGKQRILLRARNAARLYLDGNLIAETKFHSISSSAHGRVFEVDTSLAPNIRTLRRGDTEQVVEIEGDGQRHRFSLETIVGGQRRRTELGETSVSIADSAGDFRLLSHQQQYPLTDAGWTAFKFDEWAKLSQMNATRRQAAGAEQARLWAQRHEAARAAISEQTVPEVPKLDDESAVFNDIDHFINAKLAEEGIEPGPLTDDMAFLRRITIDLTGTIPTPEDIAAFQADQEPGRRSRAIDRFLEHPAWADNWMGYWQDVLAENPALVKPKLNNSGPFRWWLYESLADNKPFDRFVTELIRMEGGRRAGAPAGFALATQNDVPMAAKAQIVGSAFLGLNMTCARCHDAPFHDHKQRDLFALAAMLNRKPLKVPATSSIPGGDDVVSSMIVEVTLKPGEVVKPDWTFTELIEERTGANDKVDSREHLAELITSPSNTRFAEVIVNRMWHRFVGRGIVEPVDDWNEVTPSHPQLLKYLARQFVLHDYDLKQMARLILNSHTYQRVAEGESESTKERLQLFAAPSVRRMTAEQLVDSLFAAAGKPFNAGQLCLDPDSAMKLDTAVNLGEPQRAWQFASLSNERDRPSLALPFAQPFVSVLETFGWRNSRQNPLTKRDDEPTVRQPAVIANGVLGRRLTRLSDDNAITSIAMEEQPLPQLVARVYQRLLTREPTEKERELFVELLSAGYEQRLTDLPEPQEPEPRLPMGMVSWSNHLSSRANEIKIELQRAVERGDRPTSRLNADWRERLEDMVWALMNSPEFVYLP